MKDSGGRGLCDVSQVIGDGSESVEGDGCGVGIEDLKPTGADGRVGHPFVQTGGTWAQSGAKIRGVRRRSEFPVATSVRNPADPEVRRLESIMERVRTAPPAELRSEGTRCPRAERPKPGVGSGRRLGRVRNGSSGIPLEAAPGHRGTPTSWALRRRH